jgi:hypothetical protein
MPGLAATSRVTVVSPFARAVAISSRSCFEMVAAAAEAVEAEPPGPFARMTWAGRSVATRATRARRVRLRRPASR